MPGSVERTSGNPFIRNYKQATGGSANEWYAGDLVKLEQTYGGLVIATTGHILGIALKTAPGNATDNIPVDILTGDNSEFTIKSNTTTALTMHGQANDITFTAGAHVATANTTSGVDCVTVGIDARQAVGTSGGKLIVTFLPGALETGIKTA